MRIIGTTPALPGTKAIFLGRYTNGTVAVLKYPVVLWATMDIFPGESESMYDWVDEEDSQPALPMGGQTEIVGMYYDNYSVISNPLYEDSFLGYYIPEEDTSFPNSLWNERAKIKAEQLKRTAEYDTNQKAVTKAEQKQG